MSAFSFIIVEELGVLRQYRLQGSGALASHYLRIQLRDILTNGGRRAATVVESSFATFRIGGGVIVTRYGMEVIVEDSF